MLTEGYISVQRNVKCDGILFTQSPINLATDIQQGTFEKNKQEIRNIAINYGNVGNPNHKWFDIISEEAIQNVESINISTFSSSNGVLVERLTVRVEITSGSGTTVSNSFIEYVSINRLNSADGFIGTCDGNINVKIIDCCVSTGTTNNTENNGGFIRNGDYPSTFTNCRSSVTIINSEEFVNTTVFGTCIHCFSPRMITDNNGYNFVPEDCTSGICSGKINVKPNGRYIYIHYYANNSLIGPLSIINDVSFSSFYNYTFNVYVSFSLYNFNSTWNVFKEYK